MQLWATFFKKAAIAVTICSQEVTGLGLPQERGSLRPLLEPAPASVACPFVLALSPITDPSNVARTKVVLHDVGVDLSNSKVSIVSTKGLPPILQTGGLIGDGPSQLSLLLGKPLTRGLQVEVLLRLDTNNLLRPDPNNTAPRLLSPHAFVEVRYSAITTPNTYNTTETIQIPIDVEIFPLLSASATKPMKVQLLAPTRPTAVSTTENIVLERYQLQLDLQSASPGDVLHIVPFSLLYNDFRVTINSTCPNLTNQGTPIGVHFTWQIAQCHFLKLPVPSATTNASQAMTNAISVTINTTAPLINLQSILLVLPAATVGSRHIWYLALRKSIGYSVLEIGHGLGHDFDGILIAPNPAGEVLASSSKILGSTSSYADVSVRPGLDLPGGSGATIIIEPTISTVQITACVDRDLLSGGTTAAVVTVAASTGVPQCRSAIRPLQHLGADCTRHIRLTLRNNASAAVLVGISVSIVYTQSQTSPALPLLGQFALNSITALTNAKLFATGSPIGRPMTFLVTFKTSAAISGYSAGTLSSAMNATLFPAWRAPVSCSMGCARWSALFADGNTMPQGSADALWGSPAVVHASGQTVPPSDAGRSCARPALARRNGPWCFCRGQFNQSWGLCEPEITQVRITLMDASKFRLLSARGSAKLDAVPEAYATSCAVYLGDFWAQSQQTVSSHILRTIGAVPAPRRCWGDSMETTGDSLFIEWWPGRGLRADQAYALQMVGIFVGAVTSSGPQLINIATLSSTTEGPIQALQEAYLTSTKTTLPLAGSDTTLPSYPTLSEVLLNLTGTMLVTGGSRTLGNFTVSLRSGPIGANWLMAGDVVDLIFYPLAAWDLRTIGAFGALACPPIQLIPDILRFGSILQQPTCNTFSIGEAAVGDRHNAIRLHLGTRTVIADDRPAIIKATLPLPDGGLHGSAFVATVEHQGFAGVSSWYQEAERPDFTWNPQVWVAGFTNSTNASANGSLSAELAVVLATTADANHPARNGGARLRILPPIGFKVRSVAQLPENTSGRFPIDVAQTIVNTTPYSPNAGIGVDISVHRDHTLYAGVRYILKLGLVAAPSRAQQAAWHAQLLMVNGTFTVSGPTKAFESGDGLSIGLLIPGTLTASLVPSFLQASTQTRLTVYFRPAQTQGIFFRYLVLKAPLGFDFATIRHPGTSAAGNDGAVIACEALAKIGLPLHIQCRPDYVDNASKSHDVATVILPPLTQLTLQPYGFSVEAILPPYSEAWVEEASNRMGFTLETRTQSNVVADVLEPLPGTDWPDPLNLNTFLLPKPQPVYSNGCIRAQVHVNGLSPETVSGVNMSITFGYNMTPPIYLYVHAPLGYIWSFTGADWVVDVIQGHQRIALSLADLQPYPLPNGRCRNGLNHVLCMMVGRPIGAAEIYEISAKIRTPFQNPDVPQLSGLLPSPPTWHLTANSGPLNGSVVSLADRILGCVFDFKQPNRVERIYAAAATPSNTVVHQKNDVTIAITTVTTVPQGGALIVTAPIGAFAFPTLCVITQTAATATSNVGLELPQSAGASCSSNTNTPHVAVITFDQGILLPNSYMFTIMQVDNKIIIDESIPASMWKAHTIANVGNAYLDHPLTFTAFSVLEPMTDAYIETVNIDVTTTGFTKRRLAINQVVLCFNQSVATASGQTLTVFLPQGFRIPWKDSNDCLQPDPQLNMTPVVVSSPFGNVSFDVNKFTTLPNGIQISCASSTDGAIAYLTLYAGLPEITRYYAFRLVVQNGDRSPPSNFWRLALGSQASRPIPGFVMQAFAHLELYAHVFSLDRAIGAGPANIAKMSFTPSVAIPAGGALRLQAPQGFSMVSAIPFGVLLAANARCVGNATNLSVAYTYSQCEAACINRTNCSFFSVGFGADTGACVQEDSGYNGSAACTNFTTSSSFNVYQVTPTGDCFRFSLRVGASARNDIECQLHYNASNGLASAVFQLAMSSLPLAAGQLCNVTLAVQNPTQAPGHNVWGLQSFMPAINQTKPNFSNPTMLDDGIVDGFKMAPALESLMYSVEPQALQHNADESVRLLFQWASSVDFQSDTDLAHVHLPDWLTLQTNVCGTVRAEPFQTAQHSISQCTNMSATSLSVSLIASQGTLQPAPAKTRLDFSLMAKNPNVTKVKSLSRSEIFLVSLEHIRPVVSSSAAGQIRLVTQASASTVAYSVHLPFSQLIVRQTEPGFSVAGDRPVTLEILFQPQSVGANQLWISTSVDNPLDFQQAICTVSLVPSSGSTTSTTNSSAATLFGPFSCHAQHPVTMQSQGKTHYSQLRVDADVIFSTGQLYSLTIGGVGSGLIAGRVWINVSTSIKQLSADFRDYQKAVVLDSQRGSNKLMLAGRLSLRALGSGSFVALSASAEFGAVGYIAPDHMQYVTMAFALDVTAVAGDRLILYPSPQLEVLDGSLRLGLAASAVSYSSRVKTLVGNGDDVFKHATNLNLAQPTFRQRVDIVIQTGAPIPPTETSSLRFQAQVSTQAFTSGWQGHSWLMFVANVEAWSDTPDAVSNSNQQIWLGGSIPVLPAFDPLESILRVSTRQSDNVVVTLNLAPATQVPRAHFLRVAAPPRFVWAAPCILSTSPTGLVQSKQCTADAVNPEIVILQLAAPLMAGMVNQFAMQAIAPTSMSPPNIWEVAVLNQTSVSGNTTMIPEQVIRLFGYELQELEAFLEPQLPHPASGALSAITPWLGHHFLLHFKIDHPAGDDLRLAAAFPGLRIIAPYPLIVDCPAPRSPANTSNFARAAWAAWQDNGYPIPYPFGADFTFGSDYSGPRAVPWVDSQLLGLNQQAAVIKQCVRKGWRGAGSMESAGGQRSSINMELHVPFSVGRWIAVPLLARILHPIAGSQEASADEFNEISTPSKFWTLELRSAMDGRRFRTLETLRARPHNVLNAALNRTVCISNELCASIAGAPLVGNLPPPLVLQLGHGIGIAIRLELTLPRALAPAQFNNMSKLQSIFGHQASGSPFPADVILGSYVEVTAPLPLQWLPACTVADSAGSGGWQMVCFGGTAFLSVQGSQQPAGVANLVLSNLTLIDITNQSNSIDLPLTNTWIFTLFELGVLRSQHLTSPSMTPGVTQMPHHVITTGNVPVGIGADVNTECIGQAFESFPCPEGMFAYGVLATRLGGVDSWVDSLQMLCSADLYDSVNFTGGIARLGASTIAGNVHLGSRSNEQAAGAITDHQVCDSRSSSVVAGGRVELLLGRQIMGIALACMPWASVERHILWDRRVGAEVRPARPMTKATAPTSAQCTGNVQVPGSDTWPSCNELPDMRVCPLIPNSCCCNVDFRYYARRCEPCSASARSLLQRSSPRLCPLGTAVNGFRAAINSRSTANNSKVSYVCGLELMCQVVQSRNFAGALARNGARVVAYTKKSETKKDDSGVIERLQNLTWWQYVIGGVLLLIVLWCFYATCCRAGQQEIAMTDDDEVEDGGLKTDVRKVKRAVFFVFSITIKPVWDFLNIRVLLPFYFKCWLPFKAWFFETRCGRFSAKVGSAVFRCSKRWFERLCPCLVWCYKCFVRIKKRRDARRAGRAVVFAHFSPRTFKTMWEEGKLSPGPSPRKLAREVHKRIAKGELSPRVMKNELAKLYARGEIPAEAYSKRLKVWDLATAPDAFALERPSLVHRISSKMSKEGALEILHDIRSGQWKQWFKGMSLKSLFKRKTGAVGTALALQKEHKKHKHGADGKGKRPIKFEPIADKAEGSDESEESEESSLMMSSDEELSDEEESEEEEEAGDDETEESEELEAESEESEEEKEKK